MSLIPIEFNPPEAVPGPRVVVNRGQLLCRVDAPWQLLSASLADALPVPAHRHCLGRLDEAYCFVDFHSLTPPPDIVGYHWVSLRSQLGLISDEDFQLAGRALQITRWHREHQFCGACGARTVPLARERARECPSCALRFYPRIAPCAIGLVTRGDELLLAQGQRHPEGLYSTLAGFVEAGESAEQAFIREVKEEVGVDIAPPRYVGSQPWPFPGQLMLGFVAEYAGGALRCCDEEIVDAQWFSIHQLPTIPPSSTIAGRIIRDYVAQRLARVPPP